MELRLELRQKLEQKLELKLELKQQLLAPILTMLPSEFAPYLNIEVEEDQEVLIKSLPFLVLHEYSHPLQAAGRLIVPQFNSKNEYPAFHIHSLIHDANETGVDKGSILAGISIGKYTAEQMYSSYATMVGRVFNDIFDNSREIEGYYPFLARLHAGLTENSKHTTSKELLIEQKNLLGLLENRVKSEEFFEVSKIYQKIYQQTKFSEKYVPDKSLNILGTSSTFLH
jgi:hypothetical protein